MLFLGLKSVFDGWNQSKQFFEIPIARIEGLSAVYFNMNKTGSYIFGEDEPDEMFELLTPQSYQILDELPAEAIDFYKKWQLRGEKSAPFMARVPHVMVKGRVDIAGCRTINWQEPMSV